MRDFGQCHPLTQLIYFAAVGGIAMFISNPVLHIISLAGALTLHFLQNGTRQQSGMHKMALLLCLGAALLNPLFNHNGVTTLFYLADNPVTAEAIAYGFGAGIMLVGTLYWFGAFSTVMTSDRLLYLFGLVSPKFALVLSMALRYIPLFVRQSEKADQAGRALGLYSEDSLPDKLRGKLRVFSVMVTWALENGIVTADSMAARGYGIGRRTSFSLWRFTVGDGVMVLLTVLPTAIDLIAASLGTLTFQWYPTIRWPEFTPLAAAAYAAYGFLAFLPTLWAMEENARWKSLQSKI